MQTRDVGVATAPCHLPAAADAARNLLLLCTRRARSPAAWTEGEHQQVGLIGRQVRDAPAIALALGSGHTVEAAGIEQQVERPAPGQFAVRTVAARDIGLDEVDCDIAFRGSPARDAERAADPVDPRHLPALLG